MTSTAANAALSAQESALPRDSRSGFDVLLVRAFQETLRPKIDEVAAAMRRDLSR
jgi:hypothetical protein